MEVSPLIQEMFEAGMHLGYSRTRRHPSTVPFIFANKSRGDVVDLEKTAELLEAAMETVRAFAAQGGTILFVGTKPESRNIVRAAAERIAMPFVENRWVGGTLTNFGEIRKRVNRLVDLQDRKEKNQLVFKTKKERLMLEREIIKLEKNFGGLVGLAKLPAAIIVIDSLHEDIAVKEARTLNIPIIALANTDANIDLIQHPVVGNDSSVKSIGFFTKKMTQAFEQGKA